MPRTSKRKLLVLASRYTQDVTSYYAKRLRSCPTDSEGERKAESETMREREGKEGDVETAVKEEDRCRRGERETESRVVGGRGGGT